MSVDDNFQRRGLGRVLVAFAMEKATEINTQKAGCRFLTVDAKKNSIGFYQKLGFKTLKVRGDGTAVMYFDLLSS